MIARRPQGPLPGNGSRLDIDGGQLAPGRFVARKAQGGEERPAVDGVGGAGLGIVDFRSVQALPGLCRLRLVGRHAHRIGHPALDQLLIPGQVTGVDNQELPVRVKRRAAPVDNAERAGKGDGALGGLGRELALVARPLEAQAAP